MRIEIVCFGSELLLDKVNTNSNAIAEKLESIGLEVSQVATVGDDRKDAEGAIRDAMKRSDAVITCGGLGPTFDDLTRECAANVLGRRLVYSPAIHERIRERFRSINLPMPEENKNQTYLIQGAREIRNDFGTAPGQIAEKNRKSLILLPGPAKECLPMMTAAVLPYLKKRFGGIAAQRLLLHVYGQAESAIDEMIQPVTSRDWNAKGVRVVFGILAHRSIIDVKASARGRNRAAVSAVLNRIEEELRGILGDRIFGKGEETLESAVGGLLKAKRQTLATAESCTGGRIGNKITDIAGSSSYFMEGAVTYSNASKIRLLGVRKSTLEKFGAVSGECAEEMARGIRRKAGTDWGLSVTGIAGPEGGSKAKPIGTVYFGIASKDGTRSVRKNFFGSRIEIKERSSLFALNLLRLELSR